MRQHGVELVAAVEEWASARKTAGPIPLADAVRFYAANRTDFFPSRKVAHVADEFVESLRCKGVSDANVRNAKIHRKGFTAKVSGESADVTVAHVNGYLYGLKTLESVSRNGIRRNIVTMFGFAKRQGYLHPDRKTAACMSSPTPASCHSWPSVPLPASARRKSTVWNGKTSSGIAATSRLRARRPRRRHGVSFRSPGNPGFGDDITDCSDDAKALQLIAALTRAEEIVTVKRLRESRSRGELDAIVKEAESAITTCERRLTPRWHHCVKLGSRQCFRSCYSKSVFQSQQQAMAGDVVGGISAGVVGADGTVA